MNFINPFLATGHFLYPWKQKTKGFLIFSGGIERGQWHKMGQYHRRVHIQTTEKNVFFFLIFSYKLQACDFSLTRRKSNSVVLLIANLKLDGRISQVDETRFLFSYDERTRVEILQLLPFHSSQVQSKLNIKFWHQIIFTLFAMSLFLWSIFWPILYPLK